MPPIRLIVLLLAFFSVQSCKHPLAIKGQGDITERLKGARGCSLEEFRSSSPRCTDNEVSDADYTVSYGAVPRPGWLFTGWFGTEIGRAHV